MTQVVTLKTLKTTNEYLPGFDEKGKPLMGKRGVTMQPIMAEMILGRKSANLTKEF